MSIDMLDKELKAQRQQDNHEPSLDIATDDKEGL